MRTRTRLRAVERRAQVARAVLKVIGEQGVTSLTTRTLAKEVGVTTGALFRHFETFEDILRDTVALAIQRMEQTFPDTSLPPLERVMQLARNRVALLRSDPGLAWLLRSEQAYLTLPEDAADSLRALVRRSRRYLLRAVREGRSNGSIRDDIEARALVVPIMGTIHALAGMPGVHGFAASLKAADRDEVLLALELMLRSPQASRRERSHASR